LYCSVRASSWSARARSWSVTDPIVSPDECTPGLVADGLGVGVAKACGAVHPAVLMSSESNNATPKGLEQRTEMPFPSLDCLPG
jgi:hypothetical protein